MNDKILPAGTLVTVTLLNTCGDEIELTGTVESFVWDSNKRSFNIFTVSKWDYADKNEVK